MRFLSHRQMVSADEDKGKNVVLVHGTRGKVRQRTIHPRRADRHRDHRGNLKHLCCA